MAMPVALHPAGLAYASDDAAGRSSSSPRGEAPGAAQAMIPREAPERPSEISRIISAIHARKQENRIKKACRTRFDGMHATQRSVA
jgi:hypothetical protein